MLQELPITPLSIFHLSNELYWRWKAVQKICTLRHRYQHSLVACRTTMHFSTTVYTQREWKMSGGVLVCPDLDSMFRGLHEELVPSGSIRYPIQWYCTTPR